MKNIIDQIISLFNVKKVKDFIKSYMADHALHKHNIPRIPVIVYTNPVATSQVGADVGSTSMNMGIKFFVPTTDQAEKVDKSKTLEKFKKPNRFRKTAAKSRGRGAS